MRAASLPRFLPNQPAARVAAFALFVALVVLTVLLVFGHDRQRRGGAGPSSVT